ncbi:hypothetical protein AB0A77_28330 [Streptomyces varsoviensis]|uniref:hypothetical protein n=1 Tax=Streptomyces varsoviensis TaxID=67373 RepID=UPI00340ECBCE
MTSRNGWSSTPQREITMKNCTLPRHARTGQLAVGWRRARPGETGDQPIWPILGGAPDDEPDDDQDDDASDRPEDEDQEKQPEDGSDQLGDAGKKALDSMKGRLKSERDRRRAAEGELAELKRQSAKAGTGDDAPDLEQVRAEARAEAAAEALRTRALDRLEAKAARLFADPEDARAHLASRVEEFIDGDRLDVDAISEALDELLEKKPYLKAAEAAMAERRFKDSGDGGAHGRQAVKGQLSEDDLRSMSPAQIRAAKAEGRLDKVLGRSK